MRAVRVREHGGVDKLELTQHETPRPGAGDVLVQIRAMALNHLDLWVRKGVPGHAFPLPLTLGCDGSGVVAEVGSAVTHVKPGDEVMVLPGVSCGVCEACLLGRDPLCRAYGILGETRDGTCAEFVAVPAANVQRKPPNVSFELAAAFPLTFQTAWQMLANRAELRAGETVLIHGAGSGVGSAGVQIGKFLGARVIALVGGKDKVQAAQAQGADVVLDHLAQPFAKAIKELTHGRGVDVVFEHVGAATFNDSVKCLTRGGRLVTCGATTGTQVTIQLNMLFFKSLSFLGSTMGSKGDLVRLIALLGEGRLRPVVGQVLRLDAVREAHRLLEERKVSGKVVLVP